ncbi:MAG: hypothetical protein LUF27_16210 [Lachnospiraceae bacterium]|nr:hypothetical protein [Lachnospiraceae bacterium]
MSSSTIQTEKMERIAGIYIIYRVDYPGKMYIGKALDLKRRAEQHIRNLFAGCDNNSDLQSEFDSTQKYNYRLGCLVTLQDNVFDGLSDDIDTKLSFYESIFYQAAEKYFEPYNCKPENFAKVDESVLLKAKDIIEKNRKIYVEIKALVSLPLKMQCVSVYRTGLDYRSKR